MPKKCDFEKQGCQVGKTKKIEEKSDLQYLCSLSGGNGRCYIGEQCDTMYECDQARCGSVEGYHAQRTTRHLAVTRITTQQLHNTKLCTPEHFVGLHISQ